MPEFDCTVQFRDVIGFPGYKVTNTGEVWSCRYAHCLGHGRGSIPATRQIWKKRKLSKTCRGRPNVILRRDGQKFNMAIHVLVLTAFVGPCPDGMEGCHFPDRSPFSNNLSNLRWDTKKANAADRDAHGQTQKGTAKWNSLLTDEAVRDIRANYRPRKVPVSHFASKYQVSTMAVWNVIKGRTWKHVANSLLAGADTTASSNG